MYLIHGPKHAQPDIPTIWKKMEKIQADGLAKSADPSLRSRSLCVNVALMYSKEYRA